jgi:chemotaxis protein MotA
MIAIVGVVIVIGAVLGGYLMEHGNIMVLIQPAELVIIGGAGLGTILIANPVSTIKALAGSFGKVFGATPFTSDFYLQHLRMLNALFQTARKEGLVKLESDVENPTQSPVFQKFPMFLKNHHAVNFVCDTLRMAISGGVGHFELDQMMEQDMDVHHHESGQPASALNTVADSLPGMGIVAAVLGVVITMGALGGPPEEIGHKVAAALVGTFLGILLCYGFLGPMAASIQKYTDAEHQYYYFLRVALITFVRLVSPITAIEFARRTIPGEVRPTFQAMEKACKGGLGAA